MGINIESKGMLVDAIHYMAACLPNNFPDYLSDVTMDTQFNDLRSGIKFLHKKLGEDIYQRCLFMVESSHAAYIRGDNEQGRHILVEMIDVITGNTSMYLRDLKK